jgi:nitrite reductase/ring-hydroxylating ferredoxin subunit
MGLIAVCGVDEVPAAGALCKRLSDGTQIAVARIGGPAGKIVAFENRCPHVNGPIGLGKIAGTTVTCPWHFFRFDVETGAAAGLDSVMRLRVYRTVVEGGQVQVEL